MRLAIDTSGVDQALVILDGRRVVASDEVDLASRRRRHEPPERLG